MPKFLDTNIILRFLIGDNQEQFQICRDIIFTASQSDQKLHILPQVIFESMHVLKTHYKTSKSDIVFLIREILDLDHIVFDNKDIFQSGLDIFESKNHSIQDCYYIAYCLTNQLEFVSFDRKATNLYQSLFNQPS